MKTVSSGYGNFGDIRQASEEAEKEKRFRYLVFTESGGVRGMIGGTWDYEIRGTNVFKELLRPSILRQKNEIFDTKTGKPIKKERLVKEYLRFLNRNEKRMLADEALIAFFTRQVA
ncbi:TPA: hypothetical protein DIV48_00275 [Candidatus Kaiserbacteria bacterium]|nr:MAG: hypothetical protein UY93_C0002G0220 [Parcubacteria group bacterium GW2011_GWA1_56_13]KKW46728.1 MAG: hypothetical protein UY97_C0003G0002 [Parcubacteria group bacterium GW2011_GWB1_57_6]HCR52068.1 hypothetical protein [Candidatus Kaiserbacteria bacterium]